MCLILNILYVNSLDNFNFNYFCYLILNCIVLNVHCCCEKKTTPEVIKLLRLILPSIENSVFSNKLYTDSSIMPLNLTPRLSRHNNLPTFTTGPLGVIQTSTLSGFRSLWVMPRLCRKATALQSCCTTLWLRWASGGLESKY